MQSHKARRFREQIAEISLSIPGPRVGGYLQREFSRQRAASADLIHLIRRAEAPRAESIVNPKLTAADRTSYNQAGSQSQRRILRWPKPLNSFDPRG